ncbi:MAG: type II toxin-antitoxin system VapC family toxin [Vulcanimicrobiaceae bacterium]
MRLLLDTHAFIWAASMPENLSRTARSAIEDSVNEVFVSSAVAWEIAIKHALGKLSLPSDPVNWVAARVRALGFLPLAITHEHALAVSSLPKYHDNPFDRIMIAQAQVEGLTLATVDTDSLRYPVQTLRA